MVVRTLRKRNNYVVTVISVLIVFVALLTVWPFIFNFTLSFVKTDLLTQFKFVGLRNYRYLVKDPIFFKALWHNAFYGVVMVSVGIISSLFIASLIYKTKGIAKKIYTAVYFVPVVTSMVAVTLIWNLLYFPNVGAFAAILSKFFGIETVRFLADPKIALLCIIIMDIWKDTGIRTVILLAGMEEIPHSLFEASKMDGTSSVRQFFSITLPLLRPQVVFLLAIYSINALRVFTQVYMMTGNPPGGPANSTKTLAIHMYQEAFYSLRFGYGTTLLMVLFLLLFGLVFLQIRSFKTRWEY